MADITKVGTPSLCSVLPNASANKISGLEAGEAIAAGDVCYIKSDGKVWKATGAAANAAARVAGWALVAAAAGQGVTLLFEVNIEYGSGLTPGALYYLSANAGLIADAASTGGTSPIAQALSATKIRVWANRD